MACVYFVMHNRYVNVCKLGKEAIKKNQGRRKKEFNRKKIKKPHGTMRGLKPFKCHGYGLQVSTSVCVCMYLHFFNGTTIKRVAEFLLSCVSVKSSPVFF